MNGALGGEGLYEHSLLSIGDKCPQKWREHIERVCALIIKVAKVTKL
jgi:hypothetical protein